MWLARVQLRTLWLCDELQRIVHLEAMSIGFAVAMLVAMAGGLLSGANVGSDEQYLQMTFIGGILSWFAAPPYGSDVDLCGNRLRDWRAFAAGTRPTWPTVGRLPPDRQRDRDRTLRPELAVGVQDCSHVRAVHRDGLPPRTRRRLGIVNHDRSDHREHHVRIQVLTERDKRLSGGFDADILEATLNSYAAEGWHLVEAVSTANMMKTFKAEMVMILERAASALIDSPPARTTRQRTNQHRDLSPLSAEHQVEFTCHGCDTIGECVGALAMTGSNRGGEMFGCGGAVATSGGDACFCDPDRDVVDGLASVDHLLACSSGEGGCVAEASARTPFVDEGADDIP